MASKLTQQLDRTKLLLSNCAYWSMNALGVRGSLKHINEIQKVSLGNILDLSKEFIVDDPDTDGRVSFNGISASENPENGWSGWPEPEE